MERSLGQALQGALAILTRVRPGDLGGPAPCASRDVHQAAAGVGPAGRLTAFLGRVV